MLVQSSNNRNHYQAEVNSSSSALQSSNYPPSTQPLPRSHLELWNNVALTGNNQSPSNTGVNVNASPPSSLVPAQIDSFNNNNNSANGQNNNSISSERSGYPSSTTIIDDDDDENNSSHNNDNEISSAFLSEVDLVASVNISLLKKGNNLPTTQLESGNSVDSVISSASGAHSRSSLSTFKTVPPADILDAPTSSTAGAKGVAGALEGAIHRGSYSGEIKAGGVGVFGSCTSSTKKVGDKMSDAYLSGVKPESLKNNNNNFRQGPLSAPNTPETMRKHAMLLRRDLPIISHSMYVPHVTAKKEKMEFNQMMMKMNERDRPLSYHGRSSESNSSPSILSGPVNKRHGGGGSSAAARTRKEAAMLNRRSMPSPYLENRFREKFDVSALDTNLPRIDLEAIENHLRLAREEERKRRSDREEIRRRLALESEDVNEKPSGRKPSLHSRLQSTSDSESPNSDTEAKNQQQPASLPHVKAQPVNGNDGSSGLSGGASSEDFYARQARLQAEARQALSQAKENARLQMAQEREQRLSSPITDMVKNSLLKVGVVLPPERRRVTRQLLTEMNVAQLQVIVNDLHTHIEVLNETLVSMLLERDDLHMEQDSMLVDIEDLTRYLAAKDNSPHQSLPLIAPSRNLLGKK